MSTQSGQQTDFGANEWLVYEIHQQYLQDPDSVPQAWREFLSDYTPPTDGSAPSGPAANGSAQPPAPAPTRPTAAAPAPQP
ncbi:MAG: hypothetical protein M3486_02390, partial [Actinomycetota bacterium]|nr:hypothetical protein [Actinomycetota bacterium]